MYCSNCGQQLNKAVKFCSSCGTRVEQSISQSTISPTTEWEYHLYQRNWKSGNGGRWELAFGTTEYSARMDSWSSHQDIFMPEIERYIENGWQPVNPPGPNSYRFLRGTDVSGGIKIAFVSLSTFVVEFRRPMQTRTEKERNLLGTWQEARDPNTGLLNKMGNVLLWQKMNVERWRYEFCQDRTFTRHGSDGKQNAKGVFFENAAGNLELVYQYQPEKNTTINVTGNTLVTEYDRSTGLRNMKYERTSKE